MDIQGFWCFSLSNSAVGVDLMPTTLMFRSGKIRCMATDPRMTGHYEVNGDILTCHLQSLHTAREPRPLYQLRGLIHESDIQLRGRDIRGGQSTCFEATLSHLALRSAY